MGYTIITHFNSEGYNTIYSLMEVVANERISRVPYGRVENRLRYQMDTLPFHFTVSSSKETFDSLMTKLEGFSFSPFELKVNGMGVMHGRDNSRVLYFGVGRSSEYNALQAVLYDRIGNAKYLPEDKRHDKQNTKQYDTNIQS